MIVYGSSASGDFATESGVDLIIVGEARSRKISSVLLKAGASLQREINFCILTRDEFMNRIRNKDHFIKRLIEKPVLFLVGGESDFRSLVEC